MTESGLERRVRETGGGALLALWSGVVAAEAIPWGDSAATWRVTLRDGGVVAARRFVGPESAVRSRRVAQIMVRLADAGLPVPSPATMVDADDEAWLVTPWVEGDPGSDWLDTPERAIHLAGAMGRLLPRLGVIDTRPPDPPNGTMFAHGDFAPINVLVDNDGEIVALLDLEHAGSGAPGLDAAWWSWVVRHHHPDAWTAAWPTFLVAAGLSSDEATRERLHRLALQQLTERLDQATDEPARERWRERLAIAATW